MVTVREKEAWGSTMAPPSPLQASEHDAGQLASFSWHEPQKLSSARREQLTQLSSDQISFGGYSGYAFKVRVT